MVHFVKKTNDSIWFVTMGHANVIYTLDTYRNDNDVFKVEANCLKF